MCFRKWKFEAEYLPWQYFRFLHKTRDLTLPLTDQDRNLLPWLKTQIISVEQNSFFSALRSCQDKSPPSKSHRRTGNIQFDWFRFCGFTTCKSNIFHCLVKSIQSNKTPAIQLCFHLKRLKSKRMFYGQLMQTMPELVGYELWDRVTKCL